MPSELRTDLIPEELAQNPKRIIVREQFSTLINTYKKQPSYTTTPGRAKDVIETMDLIRIAIDDFQRREETTNRTEVVFTEDDPDFSVDLEYIFFSVMSSEPGSFAEGRPGQSNVKSYLPILREEVNDPENPGYKIAILGYWYDNVVRFTCFARTNKAANARVSWFLNLMQDYTWWFRMQGVSRILFVERGADFMAEPNGQKIYGRPVDFFLRTESIRQLREKTFEELTIVTGLNRTTELDLGLQDSI
jgi:hypothetical protein